MSDVLTKAAAQVAEDVNARRRAAEEARRRATELAAEAAQAEAEAARAELIADRQPGPALGTVMREIGAQIDQARAEAVQAVRDGRDPAAAWVSYRLEARAALGRWQAFADHFRNLSGREAPPGPAHRLPTLDPHSAGYEDFGQFLTKIVRDAEAEAYAEARRAATEELRSTR